MRQWPPSDFNWPMVQLHSPENELKEKAEQAGFYVAFGFGGGGVVVQTLSDCGGHGNGCVDSGAWVNSGANARMIDGGGEF